MSGPDKNQPKRKLPPGAIAAIAAAAVVALPVKKAWEGLSLTPYRDIVGVPTVCYGETRVEMRRYTVAECEALAIKALQRDFGPGVVACVPALAELRRRNQLAAAMVFSYNVGVRGFCGSGVARAWRAGQWRAGCNALLAWNRAGGRVVQGLMNRRMAERRLCMEGLA